MHGICIDKMCMENKLKIDPKKVEYDGHSFRLIIDNEEALLKKLKEKQSEIIKDLESEKNDDTNKRAAISSGEVNP